MLPRAQYESAEGLPTGGISPAYEAAEARARVRLAQAPYNCLHRISCELRDGVLAIRGSVPSFYLKQVAQSLLCSIEGVREVKNELDVTAP
jgi:osmotically-inducible protein OsmY